MQQHWRCAQQLGHVAQGILAPAPGSGRRAVPNCRHTYASQLLTTGAVTLQWLKDQMGHTTIAMLERHYGKYICKDGPDMIPLLEHALKL